MLLYIHIGVFNGLDLYLDYIVDTYSEVSVASFSITQTFISEISGVLVY